jgi:cytochrome d ubiquinol oxidase subunit I
MLAAYLTTAFVVGGVGAWHLLRDRRDAGARLMFTMALWMAALVAPLQIVAGDLQGLNTLAYQPAKVAAMEGHFETQRGAPLILFGLPDMAAETTRFKIEIPKLGSLILTRDPNGEVKGLKAWPPQDRPNAAIVFWSFRLMVGIGLAMAAVGLWSLWRRWRRTLYDGVWLQRTVILMAPSGFVAVLAGWVTTEVGRQPFTVYGLLRTADSVSPIAAPAVGASLIAFVVVYFIVFGAGIFYLLRMMARPPARRAAEPEPETPVQAARPAPRRRPAGAGRPAGTS